MDVKTEEMKTFIKGFIDYVETHHREFMKNLDDTGESTAGTDQILIEAIASYKQIRNRE
jgi:F0F1-type ATP synthase alpha subunit